MVRILTSIKNTWSGKANSAICSTDSKEKKGSKDHCNGETLRTPKSSYLASFKSGLQGASFSFSKPSICNPTEQPHNNLVGTDLHTLLSCFNPKLHKHLQAKENIPHLKIQTIGLGLDKYWLATAMRQPWCLFYSRSCSPQIPAFGVLQ